MNLLLRRLCLSVILVLVLGSCMKTEGQAAADVLHNLQRTNLDSSRFPWVKGVADGRTKRWDLEQDGLIPVKLNGSPVARQALNQIETLLRMPLFDRDSIADVPDDQIKRGLIVSEGTAIGPHGRVTRFTCGHVSAAPGITDYPVDFYNALGGINTRLYVNLSSSKCDASVELAIHEFGHALGLGDHFPGFGSGDVISPSFWEVLFTLYHNDVGASAEDLDLRLLYP